MHLAWSMIGSPFSFISIASTGQELWHLAPQAMHLLGMRDALPRGFLTFFGLSMSHRLSLYGGLE
jgi:hypothetical protein